ncbi:hypothetical protein ACFQY7_35855 [Actinomadura luteofluorescens]|uniref:hypothetical protein n=1 Tax=Actinomadura luteofluorescens TaxID=46163 RepID=UPI00363024B6
MTKVVGSTLYLRTASGETVKVKTTGTTKIRIVEDGKLRDLGAARPSWSKAPRARTAP